MRPRETTRPVGESRALVFVNDVDSPHLEAGDHHHLARALRLRPGDPVTVSDGVGRLRPARLGQGEALQPAGDVSVQEAPRPALTVAFALTKGHRPELAVQKLTEMGIDRITPFRAVRSVARWNPEGAASRLARLRRVAREAAMQSRRAHLPVVEEVATFEQVSGLTGAALAERGGRAPTLARPAVLVGPEGGWDPSERAAGLPLVGLGATVLRAETAALVAGALLAGLRSGVVAPG